MTDPKKNNDLSWQDVITICVLAICATILLIAFFA